MLEMMEIATHPDDLLVICAETKDHPGKYATDFYRGEGHRYKALLTCDKVEALTDSKEAATDRIRSILTSASLTGIYHGSAPENCDEFVKCVREAGHTEEQLSNEQITNVYDVLVKNPLSGFFAAMIDMKKVMNASMIDEIMGRLAIKDSCDTSQNPLVSFPG